jgi:hypothetical protein
MVCKKKKKKKNTYSSSGVVFDDVPGLPSVSDKTLRVLLSDDTSAAAAALGRRGAAGGGGDSDHGAQAAPAPVLASRVGWALSSQDTRGGAENSGSAWAALDEAIAREPGAPVFARRRGRGKASTGPPAPRESVVGDPILVEFVMANPLKVPYEVTDLKLAATLEPSGQDSRCVQTENRWGLAGGTKEER